VRPLLVVDDNEDDVFFMQRAVAQAGIPNPIQVASDGQAAVDYLRGVGQFSDRQKYPLPCLVLLDLKLPGLAGLDVLRWLREQKQFEVLPVIILSSSTQEIDIDAAYRLGVNAYLAKPPDANTLADVMKVINQFWLQLNRAPRGFSCEDGI
jgi:CheY-like chemotaxis protein